MSPSDFCLFPEWRDDLKGQHFSADNEVRAAVRSWAVKQDRVFHESDDKINPFSEKCVPLNDDYFEK